MGRRKRRSQVGEKKRFVDRFIRDLEPKEVQETFEFGPTHVAFFADKKMSENYPPAPPIHARLRLSKASIIAFAAQETPKAMWKCCGTQQSEHQGT